MGHPALVTLRDFWCATVMFRRLVSGIEFKSAFLVDAESLHGFDS